MITEKILLLILLIHFIADFMFQTHEQAINKYKLGRYLFFHVYIYSFTWFITIWILYGRFDAAVFFGLATFIFHGITDAITSNCTKYYFDKKDFHNGFVIVGIDQILHYLQLYLTFKTTIEFL